MRFASWTLLAPLSVSLSGQIGTHSGIHREDMDTTCQPCTDFWRYANGGWHDKNPVPARSATWGALEVLQQSNLERMRVILEAAATDRTAAPGSNLRTMGDLYASCMDTTAIDTRGLAPLQSDFRRISSIRSHQELVAAFASFQRVGRPFGANNGVVVGAFRLTSGLGSRNSSRGFARVV